MTQSVRNILWLAPLIASLSIPATSFPTLADQRVSIEAELQRVEELNIRVLELRDQGQSGVAIPLAEESLEIQRRLFRKDNVNIVRAQTNLAVLHSDVGQWGTARRHLEDAVSLLDEIPGDSGEKAAARKSLGSLLVQLGELKAGTEYLAGATAMADRLYGTDHPVTRQFRSELGLAQMFSGDLENARTNLESVIGSEGEETLEDAKVLNNLCGYSLEAGELERARSCFERSLRIVERLRGPTDRSAVLPITNLGGVCWELGEVDCAYDWFQRAFDLQLDLSGPSTPQLIDPLLNLSKAVAAIGQPDRARRLLERALPIIENTLPGKHSKRVFVSMKLGFAFFDLRNYEKARDYWTRTSSLVEAAFGPDSDQLASMTGNLAILDWALGNHEAARRGFARSLASEALSSESSVTFLETWARLETRAGHPESALLRLSEAEDQLEEPENVDSFTSIRIANAMAMTRLALDQVHRARTQVELARKLGESALPRAHPEAIISLAILRDLSEAAGETRSAEKIQAEIQELAEPLLEGLAAIGDLDTKHRLLKVIGEDELARSEATSADDPLLHRHLAMWAYLMMNPPEHLTVEKWMARVAELEDQMKRVEQSRIVGKQSLSDPEEETQETPRVTPIASAARGQAVRDLGDQVAALYGQGRFEEALLLAQNVVAKAERELGPDHLQTGVSLNNQAAALLALGGLADALPLLRRSLAIHESRLPSDHPWSLQVRSHLGACLAALGQLEAAEEILRQGLLTIDRGTGTDDAVAGAMAFELGVTLGLGGRNEEAIGLVQRAMDSWFVSLGTESPQMGRAHEQLGALHQKNGDFAKALYHLELALAVRQPLGHTREIVGTHLHIGRLHEAMQRWQRAKLAYEEALALARDGLGNRARKTAECLDHLGNLESLVGQPRVAETYLRQALEIRQETLGEKHPSTAASHNNLGGALSALGNHYAARRHFEQALEIHGANQEDDPQIIPYLTNLARTLISLSETEKVRALVERAMRLDPAQPDSVSASIWNTAGLDRLSTGDLQGAKEAFERSLAIFQQLGWTEHLLAGEVLNNLGMVASEAGDPSLARNYYELGLAAIEHSLGPNHAHTASVRLNLAILAYKNNDPATALFHGEKALPSLQASLGREHPQTVEGYIILGMIYRILGQYEKALENQTFAVSALKKIYGPDHSETAEGLFRLSKVLIDLKDHEAARRALEQALRIRTDHHGPDHSTVAETLELLAEVTMEEGHPEGARLLLLRALAIYENSFEPNHLATASVHQSLGLAYRTLGNDERAVSSFQLAQSIRESLLGEDHPTIIENLFCLAEAAMKSDQLEEALSLSQHGFDLTRRYFANLELLATEDLQTRYLGLLNSGSVDRMINLSTYLASQSASANESALEAILHHKGRSLSTMLEIRRRLRSNFDAETRMLLDRLGMLEGARIVSLREQLFGHPTQAETLLLRRDLAREIFDTRKALVRRGALLEAESPRIDVAALQERIPEASALVEHVTYRRRVDQGRTVLHEIVYVLNATGPPQVVDLGPSEVVEKTVDAFLESLRNPKQPYREAAQRLYALTAGRFLPLLNTEVKELIIAPDSLLLLVPFAALLDEEEQFLVERFSIRYLSSGRDLLTSRSVEPRAPPLIVGGPHYDAVQPSDPNGPEAERSADMESLDFTSLHGAESEARTIAGLLGVGSDRLLIGPQATESAVRLVEGPRFLHLATHGFFLPAPDDERSELADPLLRSGIALAGFNRRHRIKSANDGVLTAAEAALLDLHGTEVIVVSACETGVGEITHGHGIFGLRRAFALAGAKTQILTLWPVADVPTRDLMVAWYENALSGIGRAESLRLAQLKMMGRPPSEALGKESLKDRGEKAPNTGEVRGGVRVERTGPDLKHPYYWAGFILSGEGGPLRKSSSEH